MHCASFQFPFLNASGIACCKLEMFCNFQALLNRDFMRFKESFGRRILDKWFHLMDCGSKESDDLYVIVRINLVEQVCSPS